MDVALDGALAVFRERGYEGTSLAELGAAMNLATGSIYKAFSDKRAVFLAAFDRYTDVRGAQLRRLLDAESSGMGRLRAMMRFYAESAHGIEGRRGCLVVGSAVALTTFDPEVASRVVASMQRNAALLRETIRAGQSDGSVSGAIDPDASADLLLCLLQGMRVVGKTGRSRNEMLAAVDQALRLLA